MNKISKSCKTKILSLKIIINVKTLKIGEEKILYFIHYFEIKKDLRRLFGKMLNYNLKIVRF